ncbi:AraC family transcriptional regulator [Ruficoccus amylovorans]|uniref:AraC family transcriptional regulator n=1 Tax=Ruficoccus amylovorans TaxID=1804625 RepID=A0A842HG09_9BACT|nr:helix-turn-helix domain-containing protein [Ruficoccus amylovorans]MBC2594474.1 AraC family transcriptional regulator [Ruficoccus amylovorans]
MPIRLYDRHGELSHLEVSSDVWFFMNHLKAQKLEAAHDHNYMEIAFVLGGCARHTTVRGQSACSGGDVLFIPRGAWHGYSECRSFELVNCLFSPTLIENELSWLRAVPPFSALMGGADGLNVEVQTLRLPRRALPLLRRRLAELEQAYRKRASRIRLLGHLLLVFDLLRSAVPLTDSSVVNPTHEEHLHPSVRTALLLLHRDYGQEWSLTRLAQNLRLNGSYLTRLFKSHTGHAPMQYLSRVRAHRAATLLLTTRLRIGDIGLRVGWPEPKLFARQFRHHFGMNASEYRRKQLQPFRTV